MIAHVISAVMGAIPAFLFLPVLGRKRGQGREKGKGYFLERVLTETDESDNLEREFIYGNYLDEALVMVDYTGQTATDHYYTHDHLFSPAALLDDEGAVEEYYEYDAYGKMVAITDYGVDETWLTADDDTDTASHHANPIAFTGQRLDNLDSNSLFIMYYKNRYYLPEQGRFAQHDPLGVRDEICLIEYNDTGVPVFPRNLAPDLQYKDGMNFYEYVKSHPSISFDPEGTDMLGVYPDPLEPKPSPKKMLTAICDKYKCACGGCISKEQCKKEAKALARNYAQKLDAWIKERDKTEGGRRRQWFLGGGRYNQCDEYSGAIMNMGLGSPCFKLKQAWDLSLSRYLAHSYVGVFHACNKSKWSDA
ncbi:MAG: hypothetical protein JXD22_02080, partial [Sedimentisphaerales bacterium]|nr:hypothetical protein [Sedimentisphaerales bacterium]